ncbi:MAG: DUF5131 family protein, partial [Casimicrobium sp.]
HAKQARGEALSEIDYDTLNMPPINLQLDWVIAGGESGHGARPAHPDWFRSLRDQCAAAGVPFHFKQWGEWDNADDYPSETQEHYDMRGLTYDKSIRVGTKKAGRSLDSREHLEFPA